VLAVFEVSNFQGAGFPEKVYERALLRELALRDIRTNAQVSLAVTYKGLRGSATEPVEQGKVPRLSPSS
jgi:GxxExxY protein